MNTETHYTEAFEELKRIVATFERGDVSVDELPAKIERTAQLIRICKSKLATTDEDVHRILEELDGISSETIS
ncbi:MAG: exodeoxyribonuclease VII small subunit [Tannerella sp.]|jgi:exodeoxyribonuclease VII small subunit|nr:exodeoxyribonuclease VII small subunit [Tannerella sp.]